MTTRTDLPRWKRWELRQPDEYFDRKNARRRAKRLADRQGDPDFVLRIYPARETPIGLDEIRSWLAARR